MIYGQAPEPLEYLLPECSYLLRAKERLRKVHGEFFFQGAIPLMADYGVRSNLFAAEHAALKKSSLICYFPS